MREAIVLIYWNDETKQKAEDKINKRLRDGWLIESVTPVGGTGESVRAFSVIVVFKRT